MQSAPEFRPSESRPDLSARMDVRAGRAAERGGRNAARKATEGIRIKWTACFAQSASGGVAV